jgi:hypothetical protein
MRVRRCRGRSSVEIEVLVQDKNLKSSATWLLVPHKTLSVFLPCLGGTRERRCEGATSLKILPERARQSEQFTASGPLHPANSRRDPDFWLVHGSKDSAAEGALLSPWCSEYCLTGEGLRQGHLGTAEEMLGSIGKRCGPLWDDRAEHGKTGQSNCWERGTKNTLYISDVYYIHAQHGSIVKEVDGFGLSFRIILENSSRSSAAISATCSRLIYLLVYRFVYHQMRAENSSRRR